MSYFVLFYHPKTLSFTPLVNADMSIAEFNSIVAAEEAAINPVAGDPTVKANVYDFAKHEAAPPPVISVGADVLSSDGKSWVKPGILGSYVKQ